MAHLLLLVGHANLDAFKSAHVFAQFLDSPSFHAEVLRHAAADADAGADRVCPGTTFLYRHNGRCKCIQNHFKREVVPVEKLSSTYLKPAITTSKSSVTVVKVSLAAPKTSITEHTTTANTTALNTSPTKPTVVKPTVAKTTVQTTATNTEVKPPAVKNPLPAEPLNNVDDNLVQPVLLHPVLICFSGACFGSNELSTIDFFKRDLTSVAHSPNASRACASKDVTVCVQGRCYCKFDRHTIADHGDGQDSIVTNCPSNHTLICTNTSCSCDEPRPTTTTTTTSDSNNTAALNPESCHFGAPICFESLCYCPIQFTPKHVRGAHTQIPVGCSGGRPLLCFHNECYCKTPGEVQPARPHESALRSYR